MDDPTYNHAEIDKREDWRLAWILSEIMNDNAPIGWSRYISIADCLLAAYDVTPKTQLDGGV